MCLHISLIGYGIKISNSIHNCLLFTDWVLWAIRILSLSVILGNVQSRSVLLSRVVNCHPRLFRTSKYG